MLKRACDSSALIRASMISLGWLCVVLGVLGFFIPVMPSTVFFLIALWAFSKGSQRFHDWLFNHRRFGPPLRNWQTHRVIPTGAKLLALAGMAISLGVVVGITSDGSILPYIYGAILGLVSAFIVTRPSHPPRLPSNALGWADSP